MKRSRRDPVAPLYKKTAIMQMNLLYCLLSEFRIGKRKYADVIRAKRIAPYNYETRNADKIRLPFRRLVNTKRTHEYRFLKIYGAANATIEKIRSLDTCKKKKKDIKKIVKTDECMKMMYLIDD